MLNAEVRYQMRLGELRTVFEQLGPVGVFDLSELKRLGDEVKWATVSISDVHVTGTREKVPSNVLVLQSWSEQRRQIVRGL